MTLPDIAHALHMSVSSLTRSFRRATGRTLIQYVNHVRIRHACRLLVESDQVIGEIALASGYRSLTNFNRVFRRIKGCSPGSYRRRFRTDGQQ